MGDTSDIEIVCQAGAEPDDASNDDTADAADAINDTLQNTEETVCSEAEGIETLNMPQLLLSQTFVCNSGELRRWKQWLWVWLSLLLLLLLLLLL